MDYITNALAQHAASGAAQRAFLRTGRGELLITNPYLTDEIFIELYPNKKIPVATAKTLVSTNVLTDAQFDHVLKIETRATVIGHMLEAHQPAADRLTKLVTSKALSRQVVDKVVSMFSSRLDDRWLATANERYGGRARLELWLRRPQDFSDADICADLLTYSTWGPRPDKDRTVQLLASRPGLVPAAARSDNSRVRMWAAGSRHLTSKVDQLAVLDLEDTTPVTRDHEWISENLYTLLALGNNPVVGNDVVAICDRYLKASGDDEKRSSASDRLAKHPEPVTKAYADEDDPTKVAWLLQRCLPYDDRLGRDEDMLELLKNPHLGVGELATAHRRLRGGMAGPDVLAALDARVAQSKHLTEEVGLQPLAPPSIATEALLFVPREREVPAHPAEWIEKAHSDPIGNLRYDGPALRHLEGKLNESDEAWLFTLALLGNKFTGTVGELAMVAQASSQ